MSKTRLLRLARANLLQIVAVFILIGAISFWSMGGCSNNGGSGDSFPQPPEINSRNGVLKTDLETIIATNFIENSETGELDQVTTPTYNGALIGPTLRMKPGDKLRIDLANKFPLTRIDRIP